MTLLDALPSLLRWLKSPGRADRRHKIIREAFTTLVARIETLEERVTTLEQDANDRLNALVGTIIAEVTSLRESHKIKDAALAVAQTELTKERTDRDETVERMVREALDADSARDTERVLGWVGQLADLVPGETPVVGVPDVGEPATPPEGSGLEVPETPDANGANDTGDTGNA